MLTLDALPAPARRFDARIGDLLLRYQGEGPYESEPLLPDAAALAALRRAVEAARAPVRVLLIGFWYLNAANWRAVTAGCPSVLQSAASVYPDRAPAAAPGLGLRRREVAATG